MRSLDGSNMSEPRNVGDLLAEAERAAAAGDLASAEQLLREAARVQEAELGESHPDLANTVNNLAVITEKAGRPDDAETFYRRAVAIAAASLPADDPMVVASRQNLEDFCYAHGRPVDRPTVVPQPAVDARPPTPVPVPVPEPATPTPTSTSARSAPPSRAASGAPRMLVIAVVAVAVAALFIARPRSPRPEPTKAAAADAVTPAAAEPVRPAPAPAPPPAIDTPAPKVEKAAVPAAVSLVTVQLCRNFSTSGWRCDPAGDATAPGPIVLYTRVRSARDGIIVHRWYRGETLRKSAQLKIGANAAEGYRTYSRQTVDRGDWRVEVRSASGDLLHEERLSVR
jgi:hypothetical protein